MKYIKTYEDVNIGKPKVGPQVGDWCLMTNWWAGSHIHDFINNTPAQITDIENNEHNLARYVVKFDKPFLTDADLLHPGKKFRDLFEDGKEFNVGGFNRLEDFIKCYGPNKEDLDIYINAKKYNL